MQRTGAGLLAAILLAPARPLALPPPDQRPSTARRTPVVVAVEKVRGAVVNVSAEELVRIRVPTRADSMAEQLFGDFFERPRYRRGYQVTSLGSGVIVSPDGYVLTNAHVVETPREWKQPVELRVLPSNGQPAAAGKVIAVGRMPDVDLAVIEVTGQLPVTPLAPDDALELGDDLVVIGAPFGRGLSVAAGIVSQVEYEHAENGATPSAPTGMKTDAAIGYGSSGGGVFDVGGGRLVGLVEGYRTARVAFGKDAEEYAFDVPMPGETFVAPAAKIRRFLRDSGLEGLAPDRMSASRGAVASPAPPKF